MYKLCSSFYTIRHHVRETIVSNAIFLEVTLHVNLPNPRPFFPWRSLSSPDLLCTTAPHTRSMGGQVVGEQLRRRRRAAWEQYGGAGRRARAAVSSSGDVHGLPAVGAGRLRCELDDHALVIGEVGAQAQLVHAGAAREVGAQLDGHAPSGAQACKLPRRRGSRRRRGVAVSWGRGVRGELGARGPRQASRGPVHGELGATRQSCDRAIRFQPRGVLRELRGGLRLRELRGGLRELHGEPRELCGEAARAPWRASRSL